MRYAACFTLPVDKALSKRLLELLGSLAEAMEQGCKQPPPDESSLKSTSRSVIDPLLQSLFAAISKYWRHNCTNPHRVMVPLFTYHPRSDVIPRSITILLSRGNRGPWYSWQETNACMKPERYATDVFPSLFPLTASWIGLCLQFNSVYRAKH